MESVQSDWKELEAELNTFQKQHIDYVKRLEEVEQMKKDYLVKFQKYNKKLLSLSKSIKHIDQKNTYSNKNEQKPESDEKNEATSEYDDNKTKLDNIKNKIDENLNYMRHISDTFPRPNTLYLKVIIGGVCVSILNKEEKWKYKEEYEKFKYTITMISLLFAFMLIFVTNSRVLDALFNFLLVWYYCTLTIRESILVVNGSRIKGWWQAHHFITTVLTAILLIWQDSDSYRVFRHSFIWFSFYLSFVQLLQYYYQKGCLYRLRALGEKEDMDTTVEGFQSWMTRGLSFLLPFLFFAYFWQLYNSYILYKLAVNGCREWQVYALSLIFFVLFAGNFLTTYMVIRRKFTERIGGWMKYKYYDWLKLKTPSGNGNGNNNVELKNNKSSANLKNE